MTVKSLVKGVTLAALLSTGATVLVAGAASAAEPTYATQQDMLKTADEALKAVTQVQSARFALFENEVSVAKDALMQAKTDLQAAESDLSGKMMRDFTLEDSQTNYLPFGMSMTLTDTFQATEENKLALQRAAGLFETAEPNEAVEVLRLADIDVSVTASLLPYEQTLKALDGAIGNIDAGDYFDANLKLKGINDSLIIRSFSIDAVPTQGIVN